MNRHLQLFIGVALVILVSSPAWAVVYSNVSGTGPDFPDGDVSFADVAISYDPGTAPGEPTLPFRGPQNALGIPDTQADAEGQACFFTPSQDVCNFLSLGVGGELVVEFTDNRLTGSNNTNDDLWIFEIGPDIEDTFVDISVNGVDWISVGKVTGSTKGVDIDAFGFGSDDLFRFVRLTDDPLEGNTDGETVGADIDAIGAISSFTIPVPAVAWLFPAGLIAGLSWMRRQAS